MYVCVIYARELKRQRGEEGDEENEVAAGKGHPVYYRGSVPWI